MADGKIVLATEFCSSLHACTIETFDEMHCKDCMTVPRIFVLLYCLVFAPGRLGEQ